MKIIHCADLHLDSKMTTNLSTEKARERKAEILDTFGRMVRYAEDNSVRAILISGDLFDSRRISVNARKTVYETIINHPDILFFYLAGNHEEDSFLSSLSEIPDNLKTFGTDWTTYEGHSVTVSGAVLTAANAGRLYASLTEDPQKFNIVMLHGQISEYGNKDRAEVIDLGRLKDHNIDYLALGHVHKYAEGSLPPKGIWCYPGCLEGRGFDECGEHGFVVLDIDDAARTCRREFVPDAKRKMYAVETDVTGCTSTVQMIDRISRRLEGPGAPSQDDLVKIVLTGSVDFSCEKNPDQIRAAFASDYYFVKVEDSTKLAVDYHEFEKDASLKGEFVRTVHNDRNLSEQEKAEIIRCGIQALSGEEIEA
ncbi:MAG: metallophosphoesterase [Eubacteriales bacterium]|jgi:exonuclease SbcD